MTFISSLRLFASLIDMYVAGRIAAAVAHALFVLIGERSIEAARFIVADGIVGALSFSLAGTLLRTIALHGWQDFVTLSIVYATRTIVKRALAWERHGLHFVAAPTVRLAERR
jgi:hypothetical protein